MNKLISVLFNVIIFGVIFMIGTWAGGRNAVNNINQNKASEPTPIIMPAPIISNIISVYKKVYYNDVKAFLVIDKTDELGYTPDVFDCKSFASTLKYNANKQGMLCAVVITDYSIESHAINAFDTLDRGIIFIEPQSDIIMENMNIGDNYDILLGKLSTKPVATNPAHFIKRIVYIC
jgi:hypothetical protein